MKVAVPRKTTHTQPKEEAILPLVPVEKDISSDDKKDPTRHATFQLMTNPNDNDAPKVKFSMTIARGLETPREMIEWFQNVCRVCRGLNLNAPGNEASRIQVIQTLARGTILTCFNEQIEIGIAAQHQVDKETARVAEGDPQQGETEEQWRARVQQAVDAVPRPAANGAITDAALFECIRTRCPYKALEKQKRFMRRKMRKPADMLTRTYVNHLQRINFEEMPFLPPFNRNANVFESGQTH